MINRNKMETIQENRLEYWRGFADRYEQIYESNIDESIEKNLGKFSRNLWIYSMIAKEVHKLSNEEVDLNNIVDYSGRLFALGDSMRLYERDINRGIIPEQYIDLIEPLRQELEIPREKVRDIVRTFDKIKSEILEVA